MLHHKPGDDPNNTSFSSTTTREASYPNRQAEIEALKSPFSTKPVTLEEVEKEVLAQGVFDNWCDRLFSEFDKSELKKSLLNDVSSLLENILNNNQSSREIPSVQELLTQIDRHEDIQRKLQCWIHRNLYPHNRNAPNNRRDIIPEIATEIENTIDDTIRELQENAFSATEKKIKSLERRERLEQKASNYKNLTEELTKGGEKVLDEEQLSGLVHAKLKRKEMSSKDVWDDEEVELSVEHTKFITHDSNVNEELFPMKKRKFTNLNTATAASSTTTNNTDNEIKKE
ncbi:hypothetical protein C9374_011894 [Naegleria lovaniensis]|uniref:Uncharacterized protein n=1 Tax=Naegleria lovaniensis TaxID=51637 RepID=A0AA88G8H1_NAELO|nr:uncharacterized protein C9374_011894 [Naegleria lovaniensis]KAG2373605.1 hypothetical protein C9374_011894 [Naegleria lovaniensis]